MSDLLTVLPSEFHCKKHMFNFNTVGSHSIRVSQFFGIINESQEQKYSAKFDKSQK